MLKVVGHGLDYVIGFTAVQESKQIVSGKKVLAWHSLQEKISQLSQEQKRANLGCKPEITP